MNVEERKIDLLNYIAFLLEKIAYQGAPGNREFSAFRELVKEGYREFHASGQC